MWQKEFYNKTWKAPVPYIVPQIYSGIVGLLVVISNGSSHNWSVESWFPRFLSVKLIMIFNKRVWGHCIYYLKSFIIQHDFPSRSACAAGVIQATIRLSLTGRYGEVVTGTEWREVCPAETFCCIIEINYFLRQGVISYSQLYCYR